MEPNPVIPACFKRESMDPRQKHSGIKFAHRLTYRKIERSFDLFNPRSRFNLALRRQNHHTLVIPCSEKHSLRLNATNRGGF